ncbi:cytoskeletal protein CcmA (bactofilin family) [Janthinobacterium sp. CG_23.3]|uniref:bactofilin family protein n=1 Tax=unclassified Janthinobacterium TaxID=2610881 RepID=UPI00034C82F7|nr:MULTISPECIES: polymer-forming cytoskeletal protein [unclassified Janthinobacterium]MEC5163856.1 cytoskeletal protein CcmA (bactofilin family) [Janthinobacterium sp. CG_S6]
MFARNPRNAMDSLIGAATRIDGDVLFKGGLRIDGQVRGNVTAEVGQHSFVVVGEHGRIDGEVRCDHLVVNGAINGPVHASELLEVQPKARIYGEVHYKVLEMHGGALVSGQLVHHDGVDKVLHLAASEA